MGKRYSFHSGKVQGKVVYSGLKALTAGTQITLNADDGNVFTLTPSASATIVAGRIKANAGQKVSLVVTTSGATSYTLTFSTNFKTTGTLATGTTTAKVYAIDFVSDGLNLNEVARTTAM